MKRGMKFIKCEYDTKGANDKGEISGYGSVYTVVDHQKEVVVPGAFKRSLEFYGSKGKMPAMCWMHDDDKIVGDWLKLADDSKGLYTEGTIWTGKGMPDAEKAYHVGKGTAAKGLSIGYKFDPKKVDVDSKKGVKYLNEVLLKEISIVVWPANGEATIDSVKSEFKDDEGKWLSIREVEEILRETHSLSAREVKALISGGYAELSGLRDEDVDKGNQELKSVENDLVSLARSMRTN